MSEQEIVRRLSTMYREQFEIYGQVLELSRQQGQMVRSGSPLNEIRALLQKKNVCLDLIKRLEMTERQARQLWERRKIHFSVPAQETLNKALRDVGGLIEEILILEEQSDMEFIERMRTMP